MRYLQIKGELAETKDTSGLRISFSSIDHDILLLISMGLFPKEVPLAVIQRSRKEAQNVIVREMKEQRAHESFTWSGAMLFDFPTLVIDNDDSGSSGSPLLYLFPYSTLGGYVFLLVNDSKSKCAGKL